MHKYKQGPSVNRGHQDSIRQTQCATPHHTMSDAAPAPDIFADTPTRHLVLNRLVNEGMSVMFPGGPEDHRGYTYLLTLIVSLSDNWLEEKYSRPLGASKKLQEDSSLKDQLGEAWKSRSYRTIRNLGKSHLRSTSALKHS